MGPLFFFRIGRKGQWGGAGGGLIEIIGALNLRLLSERDERMRVQKQEDANHSWNRNKRRKGKGKSGW